MKADASHKQQEANERSLPHLRLSRECCFSMSGRPPRVGLGSEVGANAILSFGSNGMRLRQLGSTWKLQRPTSSALLKAKAISRVERRARWSQDYMKDCALSDRRYQSPHNVSNLSHLCSGHFVLECFCPLLSGVALKFFLSIAQHCQHLKIIPLATVGQHPWKCYLLWQTLATVRGGAPSAPRHAFPQ